MWSGNEDRLLARWICCGFVALTSLQFDFANASTKANWVTSAAAPRTTYQQLLLLQLLLPLLLLLLLLPSPLSLLLSVVFCHGRLIVCSYLVVVISVNFALSLSTQCFAGSLIN